MTLVRRMLNVREQVLHFSDFNRPLCLLRVLSLTFRRRKKLLSDKTWNSEKFWSVNVSLRDVRSCIFMITSCLSVLLSSIIKAATNKDDLTIHTKLRDLQKYFKILKCTITTATAGGVIIKWILIHYPRESFDFKFMDCNPFRLFVVINLIDAMQREYLKNSTPNFVLCIKNIYSGNLNTTSRVRISSCSWLQKK